MYPSCNVVDVAEVILDDHGLELCEVDLAVFGLIEQLEENSRFEAGNRRVDLSAHLFELSCVKDRVT